MPSYTQTQVGFFEGFLKTYSGPPKPRGDKTTRLEKAGFELVYYGERAGGSVRLQNAGLRDLNQTPQRDGQLYGIHPSCAGLQELFNGLGGDAGKRRAARGLCDECGCAYSADDQSAVLGGDGTAAEDVVFP